MNKNSIRRLEGVFQFTKNNRIHKVLCLRMAHAFSVQLKEASFLFLIIFCLFQDVNAFINKMIAFLSI